VLSYIKYLYIYYNIILFEFSGIKKVAGEGVMYKKVQHAVQSNRQVKKEKILVNDRTNKKPARFFFLSNKNKAKQKVHFEKNNNPTHQQPTSAVLT
jgi:hypothetical protein